MKRGSSRGALSRDRDRLRSRWWILLGSLGAMVLLILGRAVQLQVIERERWAQIAEEQHRGRVPLPPRRGGIYDRNGLPLVLTHETFTISVAPWEVRDPKATAARLVEVLGISTSEARQATDRSRRWVVLPGRFGADQRKQLANLRGLHFERRFDRFYPQGEIGREIVGVVTTDGRALGGMEQQFDDLLRGEPGYSVMRRDARGRIESTISLPVVPPTDGADIYLTIDFNLQEIADAALREAIQSTGSVGGDLLLSDPKTGEILAAVSRREGKMRGLSAFTEPYEPGSTLKPLLVAALLAEGRASLDEEIYAEEGTWKVGPRTIQDSQPYEWISLRDAIRVSSNIAIVKLASRLRPGEQFQYLRDFGFGTPTGVEFPAESGGRLRRPAHWSSLSQGSLAMGYEISVTPLQVIGAYGALANGGVVMEPHLLHEIRAPGGEVLRRNRPQPLRRVVSGAVAEQITEVLVSVVEDGTGTRASLATFQVAGKTGTARRTGEDGSYERGSYTASFAGYFPARDPQLVIFVKLDRPQGMIYSGQTAAPVTRETLQGILAARSPTMNRRSFLSEADGGEKRGGSQMATRVLPTGREGPFVYSLTEGVPLAEARSTASEIEVPALEGLPLRDAARRVHTLGLRVRLRGSGSVESTHPAAGARLAPGDTLLLIGNQK